MLLIRHRPWRPPLMLCMGCNRSCALGTAPCLPCMRQPCGRLLQPLGYALRRLLSRRAARLGGSLPAAWRGIPGLDDLGWSAACSRKDCDRLRAILSSLKRAEPDLALQQGSTAIVRELVRH